MISNFELESLEFEHETFLFILAYHKERIDDFYLFMFCEINQLTAYSDGIDNIEYSLNSMIGYLLKNRLQEFNTRSIKNNLSLVVVLESEHDLKELYRIEENIFNSKKYLLIYQEQEKTRLKSIFDEDSYKSKDSFQQLLKDNGSLIDSSDNDWYMLLLKLFIKVPFVNYEITESQKKSLISLQTNINDKLHENEKSLLNVIIEYQEEDIKSYIKSHNIL